MNIEEYRLHCLSKKGVTESIPFSKLPNLLVFKVMGKMFTATDISTFESFSIKCDPETIEELREKHEALQEPSYLSKKHWCFVLNKSKVSDQLMYSWIDTSYDLVVKKLTKKQKIELQGL